MAVVDQVDATDKTMLIINHTQLLVQPPQLVQYANTLLKDRVLFGSD